MIFYSALSIIFIITIVWILYKYEIIFSKRKKLYEDTVMNFKPLLQNNEYEYRNLTFTFCYNYLTGKYCLVLKPNFKINTIIEITHQNSAMTKEQLMELHDVIIGDPDFDEDFVLSTHFSAVLSAIMNFNMRNSISKLNHYFYSIKISNNEFKCEFFPDSFENSKHLQWALDEFLDIFENFNNNKTLIDSIYNVIVNDPMITVQEYAIDRLMYLNTTSDKIDYLKKIFNQDNIFLKIKSAYYLGKQPYNFISDTLKKYDTLSEKNKEALIKTIHHTRYKISIDQIYKMLDKTESDNALLDILKIMNFYSYSSENIPKLLSYLNIAKPLSSAQILKIASYEGDKSTLSLLLDLANKNSTLYYEYFQQIIDAIDAITARTGGVERGWVSFSENNVIDGALSTTSDIKGGLSNE